MGFSKRMHRTLGLVSTAGRSCELGIILFFIAKKAFELIVEEALGPRTNRGQTDQHDVSYSF